MTKTILFGILAATALGCGGSGMGEGVRADITERMTTVQAPLSSCYETALQEKRKLRGTMWLKFDVEPKTGKFANVSITRSEIKHAGLESCVISTVSRLALVKPQKSTVSVDYPVNFTPQASAEPAAPPPAP